MQYVSFSHEKDVKSRICCGSVRFLERSVFVRYMLPRSDLQNSYDMDCNCRKREEESKRKEAKLQKGMQNVEQNKFRLQQNPTNREKATSVPQLPNKAADTQSKRLLSLNASQIQPGRNSRGSPKAGHDKGTPKESCVSAEPQSEGHKIRQGLWYSLIVLCFVHFLGVFYVQNTFCLSVISYSFITWAICAAG